MVVLTVHLADTWHRTPTTPTLRIKADSPVQQGAPSNPKQLGAAVRPVSVSRSCWLLICACSKWGSVVYLSCHLSHSTLIDNNNQPTPLAGLHCCTLLLQCRYRFWVLLVALASAAAGLRGGTEDHVQFQEPVRKKCRYGSSAIMQRNVLG